MKISPAALAEVEAAFKDYVREVLASDARPSTKDTYVYHSESFVRWMKDDFEPGVRVNMYRKPKRK
jgi:hypothetical protein